MNDAGGVRALECAQVIRADSDGRVRKGGFSVRWDSVTADEAYGNGWWVRETLADHLRSAAADAPDRLLVVDGDLRLSTHDVLAQAEKLAHGLLERVPAGSVVSFMLPNWHEAVVLYHAITLAGMVAHPILPSLRDHELKFQLRDVGSRMIFIPSEYRQHDYVAMLSRVVAQMRTPPQVVVIRGAPGLHFDFTKFLESDQQAALPVLDADTVRLVMYTSGTTGRSKGVLHTQNTLHALMRQIAVHWQVSAGDVFLVPSPISHIGGSIYAFEGPVLLNTTVVLMDRWEPQAALTLIKHEGCTHMCGATPFLEQLLEAAKSNRDHLPTLKVFVCGGASVPPSLIRHAAAQFPSAAVTRVYGSTEVPVTTVGCPTRSDLQHAADTDGRPGMAVVRIADNGEIRVKGPQMLVGYLHLEDEVDAFDTDGFFRTGDIGRWQDDNCLVVCGRSKDIIIRYGENIAPKEIEDILVEHPGIAEVAIVGLPDARTGERACAVIVPTDAVNSSELNVESLCAFLLARGVAKFKYPEGVALWRALPKNDTGKVLKNKIREQLLTGGSADWTEMV